VAEASANSKRSYEVQGPLEVAVGRVRDALGADVIVRDEEDGLGRFAGERPIMFIGRGGKTLKLLRGSWGDLKGRVEEPMVEIRFGAEGSPLPVEVERVEKAGAEPSTLGRLLGDFVSTAILIAAAIYALNTFRGQGVDYTKMAMIVTGASALYVAAKHFFGDDEEKMGPADWLMARCEDAFSPDAADTSDA
jgi:hypothetical protein